MAYYSAVALFVRHNLELMGKLIEEQLRYRVTRVRGVLPTEPRPLSRRTREIQAHQGKVL